MRDCSKCCKVRKCFLCFLRTCLHPCHMGHVAHGSSSAFKHSHNLSTRCIPAVIQLCGTSARCILLGRLLSGGTAAVQRLLQRSRIVQEVMQLKQQGLPIPEHLIPAPKEEKPKKKDDGKAAKKK